MQSAPKSNFFKRTGKIVPVAFALALVFLIVLLAGCTSAGNGGDTGITTFKSVEGTACKENGKPVIDLFSTTWCPHCQWIKPTYDRVAKEYVDQGKIVAHHWELDTGDDTLTTAVETKVPDSELAVYNQINPKGTIPTFVFGCKYYRIGTGYEKTNDLNAEEKEFRAVIEELIKTA
jgi:thiol-disulfide isomerase/thioredoxin